MPREFEQSSPLNDEKQLNYVTRRQATREIENMMKDCKQSSDNSYHFPKYGGLLVKLSVGKSIRDYVVRLIESRHNLTGIEKVANVK
jgi:hypothetical protein